MFTGITHVRHVAMGVPDFEAERAFYTDMWGLSEEATDSGVSFLAAEGSPERYVVRLRKSDEKRLDLLALGTDSPASVDALAEQLGQAGIEIARDPGPLDTPGGGYGMRLFDLDGRTIEVSADVEQRTHRAIEERESIPVKLSHAVFNTPDIDRTAQFYIDHLGFQRTDTLIGKMHFLRCSQQHHSLAIARGPHVSLHHASFEMRGIDEYMRGTGRLLRGGIHKIWGPGRHLVGDNTFSYFHDPQGNMVEYTTELEVVCADWEPGEYDPMDPQVSDQWGTANPMDELVSKQTHNDVDRGLFIAPPI